jgi:hypothetical protein
MKIDRIHYQKVFPVGAYLTERIGFEASLDEGENADQAVAQMRQMAEDIHKANNPHLYINGQRKIDLPHPEEASIQVSEPISTPVELPDNGKQQFSRPQKRVINLIESSKSLEDLAKFKDDAAKEGVMHVYAARVKYFNDLLLTQ